MKKFFIFIVGTIALAVLLLLVTGHKYILTGIGRTYMVGNTTANIDDHTEFKTRVIKANKEIPWVVKKNKNLPQAFLEDVKKNDAVAFLVAHKGKIISENYFAEYSDSSKTNSFSMAKTVVTLLLAKAIEEGYIKGLEQPLVDFLPEFKNDTFGKTATIGSLSSMSSGYDWDESYYNPFSPTVELLYGDNVANFLLKGKFTKKVDTYFYYSSASTELLTIAISRALQKKHPNMTLGDYLSEKLWQPLGMNADALWHLDNSNMELGFCCLNTNARNFARLGQLMLQHGNWEGTQLIDSSFIALMHKPKFEANYGYATWIGVNKNIDYYYFRGHLGQFIIIVPAHDLVVVRLGKTAGKGVVEENLDHYVEEAIKLL